MVMLMEDYSMSIEKRSMIDKREGKEMKNH
jgi:hypothetical protein